ncbi:MAG: tetratricopeptide repeat protein [Desulfamplus sp.]|nr:tetratricopeptide repeat protein [Desulfamplus sp.]
MLKNNFIRTHQMDTLILSIIDSIRDECFIAAFKNNRYSEPFELEPSIKQAEESIILKYSDDTTQQHDQPNLETSIASKLPSKDFNKAAEYYNAGKLDEAEQICNSILNSESHGASYNLLAHIVARKGDYDRGIDLMHKALELNNASPTYNNNMGNMLFEQKRFSEAAQFFKKTIQYKPDFAEAHFNLGLALVRDGEDEKALPHFEKTIQLRPDIFDAYTNIGNIYMAMKKAKEAVDIYKKALALKSNDMVISVNLALALQEVDKLDEAEKILSDALIYSPDNPELLFNIGNVYQKLHKTSDAVDCYKKALEKRADDSKINYNLGTTFMESGQYTDAIPCFEAALELAPNNTQALNNMGMVHFKIGDNNKALTYYEKALSLNPYFSEVHNNIGLVYKLLEQKEKSMSHFKRAIELNPKFGEAFHNLAEIQRESHLFNEAFDNSSIAIELEPELTPAYTNHAYLLRWLCEWKKYDEIKDKLDSLVKTELASEKTVGETPFMNLIRSDDPSYNKSVADHFANKVLEKAKNLNISFPSEKFLIRRDSNKKKIILGYLSANFRYHPLAHLLANLFNHHNKNQFQINCYSMGPDDGSEYRKRFEEDSDIFRDIRNLNHAESAQLIFDDKVDILIDLMGYTQGNRLEVAALRPAPIQVRYMGMPGTTGSNLFDYIIVDEIVLPRNQQKYYAEKFIYMPYTYQINDRSKKISDEPVTRQMFNLPDDSFVFCSFNTSYKTDPVIFSAWMDILRQTENSVLWLMPDIERAGDNMRKVAQEHGIDPKRLIYTNNIKLERHLARIGLADLALDTRTVGGAATTSDALWGGVPVITLLGSRFVSRMSASILSAIGLDELITDNIEQYKELAINFANNRDSLKQLKTKLRQNIETMPLFNTEGFTRHLERGFRKIWDVYVTGEKPQIVDLKENMDLRKRSKYQ